jgi:hypothetical protein
MCARKMKLKELNKEFSISTVQKPPPLPIATTRICQKMEEDRHGTNGPNNCTDTAGSGSLGTFLNIFHATFALTILPLVPLYGL